MALMKLSPLTLSITQQKLSCFGEPQMPSNLRSPPIKLSIRASISKVCVYCGSNSGTRQVYKDAALDLGARLVEKKVDLVYGGGNIGLMGLVSQTVYDGGCHVLGIIPGPLIPVEIKEETSKHTVGELLIVSDMHERKAEMARRADAFIALPGGYGTMEELLEVITWSHLGIHNKPVGILNVDGYYDSLLSLFDKGVQEGFIKPSSRNIIISANNAQQLLHRMEEYTHMHDQVASSQSWNL
ncbi:hypothetical protein LWI28_019129 [Acer negundo]|uniref:Cytokinin riboside 5'-monophosphate phosphoribohydrolase n=1 Tax=Acer negundo TaxID=4023 RepID=A0AAD5JLQ1_ACENE|nr:hypothetical protein LWI28_019129 [Acer negundo]KAK4854915.1 hypothetical protein QYF36_002415 [Acer negundo]